jgi:ABC-type polysaccharide/polyol phosphate transport system ATPase subunit
MSDAIVLRDVTKIFRLPLDRSTTLKYRVTHLRSSSRYKDLYALRGVTFSVPEGQFLGIIGSNGSGKSTLLKVLSRIYAPTSGTVAVNGVVSPFLELGVGFNPELTARENVFLNGAVLGLTRRELEHRVDDIIAFAEVSRFADQKLKNFSSGMQVRLAFSVAIQADAGILLMDEVLAVGDASFQQRCFDTFARYKREGRTVVLVTHDLESVSRYCDRALLIDEGVIVADDVPHEVVAQYRRIVGDIQEHDQISIVEATQWGSGDVEIADIAIIGSDGRDHKVLTSLDTMTIRVRLRCNRPVTDEIVLAIGVHRNDGLQVAASNNRIDGVHMTPPAVGEHLDVEWTVPALPLLAGSYLLSLTLHDYATNKIFHTWEAAHPFKVIQLGEAWGLVDFSGTWSVFPEQRVNDAERAV